MTEGLSISYTAKLKAPIASTDLVKVVKVQSSYRSRLRCRRKYQNRINLEDYSQLAKTLSKDAQKELDLDSETFLREKANHQEATLSLYEQTFGEQLPLKKNELNDFIYQRNLVTRSFWRVTGADVKGGEKLANPKFYLKEFLAKCEYWQVMLDNQSK